MARRRRRTQSEGRKLSPFQAKLRDLVSMAVAGTLVYAVLREHLWAWAWVLDGIWVLCVWWLFFMPTYCDQRLRTDLSLFCSGREVRGKLRGCWQHRRDKRDAVFALLNMRNPGMLFRLGWGAAPVSPAWTTPAPPPDAKVLRETWTLILTAVSTVAGVASAVFAVVYA